MSAAEELQRIAEFGHPFRVTESGQLADDVTGVYAPDVHHDETDDMTLDGVPYREASGWEALTGYTGQHGYRGPVMHASEFLGGGIAGDILSTPGVYVVTSVEVWPVVPFPHAWSPSGARCTRSGCDVAGTGDPDDAPCLSHPDYDEERQEAEHDSDPFPAGWTVLRRTEGA